MSRHLMTAGANRAVTRCLSVEDRWPDDMAIVEELYFSEPLCTTALPKPAK